MAKLTRKLQKLFGSGAGGTGITEFGSPATGTPVYTTDLDAIQTPAYENGWADAALAGGEIPAFQDFNALNFANSYQIKYIQQEGICEFLATETYPANGVVKKSGTYELYGSIADDNTGNALPSQADNANWTYLGLLGGAPDASETVKGIVELATDAEVIAGVDTTKAVTPAGLEARDTNQPLFVGYRDTGNLATGATVVCNQSIVNRPANTYNTATGVFTCPSDGDYLVAVSNQSTASSLILDLNKNGVLFKAYFAGNHALSWQVIVPCVAGDELELIVNFGTYIGVDERSNTFNIRKL